MRLLKLRDMLNPIFYSLWKESNWKFGLNGQISSFSSLETTLKTKGKDNEARERSCLFMEFQRLIMGYLNNEEHDRFTASVCYFKFKTIQWILPHCKISVWDLEIAENITIESCVWGLGINGGLVQKKLQVGSPLSCPIQCLSNTHHQKSIVKLEADWNIFFATARQISYKNFCLIVMEEVKLN